MKNNVLQKEKWMKSYNIILETLSNYELGDAYLIIQGLELVGYSNRDFWFKIVEYIKKYKGIETLVNYIDIMQHIEREKLMIFLEVLNNKMIYPDFESSFIAFSNLLSEIKKYYQNEIEEQKKK